MPQGRFTFPPNKLTTTAPPAAQKEIIAAVSAFWDRYLHLDAPGYTNLLAPDVIRLSQRANGRQVGRAAVSAGLPIEWEAFERPNNLLAESMTVERAELSVEGDSALLLYWVDIEGGAQWDYTDQYFIVQALVKQNNQWLTAHYVEAGSLDYNVGSQQPGPGATFDFDYAYPVKDLARAVKFYTPLLGAPENVTTTRATFSLKGARFILDASEWGGLTRVQKNLPNGYAHFLVADVEPEVERLKKSGVTFANGPQKVGPDTFAVGLDPDGNVFVLCEKNFKFPEAPAPTLSGFPTDTPWAQAAQKIAQAWLANDVAACTAFHDAGSTWFDDTRTKTRGQERGAKIATALQTAYWPHYDHSPRGLIARLTASSFHVRPLGSKTLVSYERLLTGVGPHAYQETAWVTHIFNTPQKLAHTIIIGHQDRKTLALEFDYTGYPVTDLARAEKFYDKTMRLGEGYDDESYYGYWSNRGVFGLYEADPDEDHIPRPRQSNGYISFWVRSARETHAYLKQQGCSFPTIPAINDVAGIDPQPGYTQVVTTDSEGNIVIFTEYLGRPR